MPLADAVLSFGSPGASVKCADGVSDRHAVWGTGEGSSQVDERVFSLANGLDPVPKAGSMLYRSTARHRLLKGPSVGLLAAFGQLVKAKGKALALAGCGLAAAAVAAPALAAGVAGLALPAMSALARVKSHSMVKYKANADWEIGRWMKETECRNWTRAKGWNKSGCLGKKMGSLA